MAAEGERIRVYVADDHPLFREAVAAAIGSWPDLDLIGQAADGAEALAAIRELRPAVAVLDMRMPGLSGAQIAAAIAREELGTRVVLLSGSDESELVYAAVEAGVAAYLSKDAGGEAICQAIMAVSRGETVLSPAIHEALAEQIRGRAPAPGAPLTARELEVLALLADGLSAPAIAEHLMVGPATVKTHLHRLYGKLGVGDRAAAVAEAMRRRLLD